MKRTAESELTLGTAAVLAGGVVALLGSLLLRVILARALAADELGLLVLGIAVVSCAGGLASLGVHGAVTRRIAELSAHGDQPRSAAAALTALLTAAVAALPVAAIVLALPLLVSGRAVIPALAPVLAALLPVVPALAIGIAVWGISQGHRDVRGRALLRDGGGSMVRLAAVAAVALAGGGLTWLASGFAAGSVVAEVSFLAYAWRMGWLRVVAPRFDRKLLASLPPFTGMTVLNQMRYWLDMLLIGFLAAPAVVGVYGVARGLGQAMTMLWEAALHRFLPMATQAWERGDGELLGRIGRHTHRVLFALMWPPVAVSLLCPHAVITTLFGEAYVSGATALRILALGFLVLSVVGYAEAMMVAMDRTREVLVISFVATATLVVVMVVGVPRYGASGAAAAATAHAVLRSVLAAGWLRRAGAELPFDRGFLVWLPLATGPALLTAVVAPLLGADEFAALVAVTLAAVPPLMAVAIRDLRAIARSAAPRPR